MELGLHPVAGDMSLPSGFKKHLKSVSTRISGKRDIPMDERTIHGDALAFFVVPQSSQTSLTLLATKSTLRRLQHHCCYGTHTK